jgi:putative transposase
MPRKIRYIIPGIPHHAFQRGNNRQNIFLQEEDRIYFIKHLKQQANDNNISIGSYCLMTNHFHFLIIPETEEGLIKFMKNLLQRYSQYFNWKHKRTGKVWENRYKLNLVEPESAWVAARYIERNPVRVKIAEKAEEYRYSSAAIHLKGGSDPLVTEDILNNDRDSYVKFFHEKDADDKQKIDQIETIIQQQKAIGSSDFLKRLEEKFGVGFGIKMRGRPRK